MVFMDGSILIPGLVLIRQLMRFLQFGNSVVVASDVPVLLLLCLFSFFAAAIPGHAG